MTLKHINRPIAGCAETRPTERVDGLETTGNQPCGQVRPDPRKVFLARWKRNEPGLKFLADR
jgi:hypothetical protein